MKADLFKSIVAHVIEPQLSALGYAIDLTPPGKDFEGFIWFEKMLQDGIYLMIEVQPRHMELNKLMDFAVNLTRNSPRYGIYRNKQLSPKYLIDDRLASWLWIEDRDHPDRESDHWWHFLNEEELADACLDVLGKLLKYGIPYLEDLTSKSPKLQGW